VDDHPGGAAWEQALRTSSSVLGAPRAGGFAARLDAWVAEARVDGSAEARSRERWLRAAAEADATFGGMLLDLAERGQPVAVATTAARRHHGTITAIGLDFVALRAISALEVLLPLRALTSVRSAPGADAAMGERIVTSELRLRDVLGELAVERTRVLLVTGTASDSVAGELRSVGQDVVVLRLDGEPAGSAYVPLSAVGEVGLA
jgi:hypothetical protein